MNNQALRALFVCAHLPSPDAPQAGHKIAYTNLSTLAKTHLTDVLVACKSAALPPSNNDHDALARHANEIHFVAYSPLRRRRALLQGLLYGIAPRFATRYHPSCKALFYSLLDTHRYDVIWIEFSQCFWLAAHINARANQLVLSVHDVITQLVSTKPSYELSTTLGWTFLTERRLLEHADRVRVLSKKDALLLHTLFRLDLNQIEIQPPELSFFVGKVRRQSDLVEPHSILFWGAMSRSENYNAVLEFASTVFPRLQKKYPATKLYVVGSAPPPSLIALASTSIVVTGFVDDPTLYFERSSVGIAPLRSGAGIKLKVLEMLQAGLPVVSTPLGAEGITANPNLIVAELEEFTSAIQHLWIAQ